MTEQVCMCISGEMACLVIHIDQLEVSESLGMPSGKEKKIKIQSLPRSLLWDFQKKKKNIEKKSFLLGFVVIGMYQTKC